MRFKVRTLPPYGSERIVKRFTFLPKKIRGEYVWLEFIYIKQRYEGKLSLTNDLCNIFRKEYYTGWNYNIAYYTKEEYSTLKIKEALL